MRLASHHNMPDHTLCLASSYCSPLLGARLHCIKVSTSHTRVSLLAIAAPLPGTTLRQRLHIAFLTAVQAVTVCGVAAAEPSKGEQGNRKDGMLRAEAPCSSSQGGIGCGPHVGWRTRRAAGMRGASTHLCFDCRRCLGRRCNSRGGARRPTVAGLGILGVFGIAAGKGGDGDGRDRGRIERK